MNRRQRKKRDKKLQEINEKAIYESGDANANDLLDLVDSAKASSELLDQVEDEVDILEDKVEALKELNDKVKDMSAEEIAKITELIAKASIDKEMMNAPLTNEAKDALAQEQAENLANALIAADNAKHPIKFAMGQMGVSLDIMKNIPAQMRENIAIARTAELDCNTSLQNAALVVTAKTTNAFETAKNSISTNAVKIAEGATSVFNKAVENTISTWEKVQSKAENLLHKATKAFDISMEAITLGGWSRFCVDAAKRADTAHKNGNYDFNGQLNKANEKGFQGGRTLFGVNLDDNKLVNAKEKAVNFLATAFTRVHGNMEGLETSKELSNEGRTRRNQDFADYWKEVKGKVWSKTSDVSEKVSGVKGDLGATSPMDVLAGKAKEVSDTATKLYQKADKQMHKGFDAAKEMGTKTKDFFKALPGNIANGAKNAKDAVCKTAKNIAASSVELTGKGAAGFLRGVAFLSHQAATFDRSQARRLENIEKNLNNSISKANTSVTKLNNELDGIEKKKIQATPQIPNELVEAKKQLMAASPTANISKAIDKIIKEEKDIENKANRSARMHNMGVTLKNANIIISDKISISQLNSSIKDANKKIKSLKEEKKSVENEAQFFENAESNISKTAGNVQSKMKDIADKIRGNGPSNENGNGGGRGDGDEDRGDGPDLD